MDRRTMVHVICVVPSARPATLVHDWSGDHEPYPTIRSFRSPRSVGSPMPACIKSAIDGENLPGDVACAIAAQENNGFRQFFLEPT